MEEKGNEYKLIRKLNLRKSGMSPENEAPLKRLDREPKREKRKKQSCQICSCKELFPWEENSLVVPDRIHVPTGLKQKIRAGLQGFETREV